MKKCLYSIFSILLILMMLACDVNAQSIVTSQTEAEQGNNVIEKTAEPLQEVVDINVGEPVVGDTVTEETPVIEEPTPEPTEEPVVVLDTTPPEIFGVKDKECILGQTIVYFKDVYAVDDIDGDVQVTVDSDVNMNKVGEYQVVYKAVDSSGNEATVSCVFTVVEPDSSAQVIHELAKEVIDSIITDDMLDVEKAKAIFDYVHTYMHYGNGTNNNYTDWRKAAYQAFTTHSGDCYNIWAMTKALLDETDIEYKDVERVKTHRRKTRHYWCIVNLGTGWYVFDPTYTPKHKAYSFMWNESQCQKFPLYWNYDKTILPELAKERFDYNKELKRERELRDAG